jgi:hypothetical protein
MREYSDEERDDFASQDGVQLHQRRRSPPRLPAGTLRIHGDNEGGCIPISTGEFLTDSEKGLLRLILGEVINPLRFGAEDNWPVADDQREALLRMGRELFACEHTTALWLVPFLTELEVARSERLALETKASSPLDVDLHPVARAAIERTLRRAKHLAPSIELPQWLSPELVELFVRRFSFSGGGGPYAALTREAIQSLLVDQRALADYLRSTPKLAARMRGELLALDAAADAGRRETPATRARAAIIDAEHSTSAQRRDAQEGVKRTSRSMLSVFLAVTGASLVRRFVGVRFTSRDVSSWLRYEPAEGR